MALSNETIAALKWAGFVVAWCAACGLAIGLVGTPAEGVTRVVVVAAKAVILVALVNETIRTGGWAPRMAKAVYALLIAGLLIGIERLTGGWDSSFIAALVGAIAGAVIGLVVAGIGWAFDNKENSSRPTK